MYRNAPFWFAGILVVLVLGFWPSYFSPSASEATFGQHFHSVMMLGWMLMLILQSWLMRAGKRDIHRAIGKFSLLWAPLLVVSALLVVYDHLAKSPQPYPPIMLSFFWLGLAAASYYTVTYILAIRNRKDMQLHARYMAATVLAFITPGLGRLSDQINEATGITQFNFVNALWVPVVAGAVMVFLEWRKGRVRFPWVLATALQLITVLGFFLIPRVGWWTTFADWYLSLA